MTSENWHKKVLAARNRFERGVMGPHPPAKITKEDIDRVRGRLIDLASRRLTRIS